MTKREIFIDYVRNGGERLVCSPQIGAGAGYDAKISGRRYCGEASAEDTIAVNGRYDTLPLYNAGLDPFMHCPDVNWIVESREKTEEKIEVKTRLDTPFGAMRRHMVEYPHKGGFHIMDAVNGPDDMDKFEYIVDRALSHGDYSCYTDLGKRYRKIFGEDVPVSVQWSMQPYELLSYPNTMTDALLPYDDEPRFFRLMDKILELDYRILDALADSGVDFVFLGGPASEIISPAYYEKYLVPYSKLVTDRAHKRGLLIYSHICSPIEPMLTKGYYNEMGIDLFETLSPKPEGNIVSLADALSKLDSGICTRGNVSLSLLMTGSPREVKEEVFGIMDAAAGRKHMVAASDYLLYDVPEENVIALCGAVKEYYG